MEFVGTEETPSELMEMAKAYTKTKDALKALERGSSDLTIDDGNRAIPLSEIFDSDRMDKITMKELSVYLIELRKEIRDILEQDEEEQLKIVITDPVPLPVSYETPVPKNDYRRQQNRMDVEEDDGK